MSYRNAKQILPDAIIHLIQEYIQGECIYIPKKEEAKKTWGENTRTKKELELRNSMIFLDYTKGDSTKVLAKRYFLSIKSIQRIILIYKKTA